MDKLRTFLNSTLKRDNSLNIREPILSESSSESESDSESEKSEMASTNLEQFVDGSSLHEYIIRFEAFLLLNRVTDDIAKSVNFVNLCGKELFSRIISVCSPRSPLEVPYSELKPLILSGLCPRNLVSVERHNFHSRQQREGKSIAEFALSLRQLAQTCDYGNSLESQLRDRFVVGLRDSSI